MIRHAFTHWPDRETGGEYYVRTKDEPETEVIDFLRRKALEAGVKEPKLWYGVRSDYYCWGTQNYVPRDGFEPVGSA